MNQQTLSNFIWSVADLLRGDFKQSEYGKVKEHRSALISAAVTGKIDVRGLLDSEAA